MDARVFYPRGEWSCSITLARERDGSLSACAHVQRGGTHRHSLWMSHTTIGTEQLVEVVQAKCIAWIEATELAAC